MGVDFELAAVNAGTAVGIARRKTIPIEFREEALDGLSFDVVGRQAEEEGRLGVEVGDATGGIEDDDAVLDGIEEGFEERTFAGEALHESLEALGAEPVEAAEDLVEEGGARVALTFHSHFLRRK